jgi:predicted nucleic acid-binding protein
VEDLVAAAAAQVWAALPARSRSAVGDVLIAATAVVHGLPLVTRNRRDFGRIGDLDGVVLPLVDRTR